MGERITSALFIILANLVLFVHAVVPHHHHYSDLCFDTFSSHDIIADELCGEPDKPHSDREEEDNCFLSNIVAPYSGEIKQLIKGTANSHDLLDNISVHAILTDDACCLSNLDFFVEIVSNDHKPIYFSLACRAFGLRAPPAFC